MEKSIHELITELCDKHVDKRKCINESINIPSVIKKLRVKAFEILLKKQPAKGCVNELEGNTDPLCHLLAWQYTLKHTHNQPETAEALNIYIQRIKESELLTDTTVQSIMLFLLYLRGKQPEDKHGNLKYNIFDKVTLKHKSCTESTALPYDLYPEHRFRFTDPLDRYDQQSMTSFSTKSFSLQPNLVLRISKPNKSLKPMDEVLKYSSDFKFVPLAIGGIRTINSKETVITEALVTDEGYESPVKECVREDIWEIASKMPVNEHRTWESLENADPVKELAFACESGPKTLHDFEKILDANSYKLCEGNAVAINIICSNQFIKKLKYMLVGMASDEFLLNDKGMFYLREGVCVEGVSPRALTSYCTDLLYCGSCYRALHQLCSSYPCRDNEKYGYIFKELCESIKRYLAYYRVAALSVPDTASLLTVHAHMHRLRDQIFALARMCKVGMFATGECQIPHGIDLLNYMYQEIVKTIDTNVGLVLYSAFYPCCQVYFSRFLQRWLFEGLLIDPYEEFMVKSELHYTNSRARTYWTRSFSLRQNAVPDFLADLKTDILQCGKTMNLLKLCNPDAPLYTDIVGRSLPLISCCLTPEQVAKLRHEIDYYYIEMAALCGPRVSLYHKLIERYEDNVMFLSLVEKKRALTIQRMELQKQREAEEKAKAKRKIFEELREQMLLAVEQKKKAKEEELQRDLQIAEQNAQMEEIRVKLLKEETQSIITYYHNLIEAVDKRRDSIEKRKQQIAENSKVETKEISKNLEPVPEAKTTEEIILASKKEDNIDLITHVDSDTKIEVKTSEETGKEISNISSTNDSNTENPKVITKTENVHERTEENKNTDEENKDTTKIDNEIVETPNTSGQSATENNKKGNLDIANANMDSPTESVKLNNQLNENFLAAQRNKAKILNLEFDVKCKEPRKKEIIVIDKDNLTDTQRNKLRVLSSEYNLFSDGSKKTVQTENTTTPESENGNTAATTAKILNLEFDVKCKESRKNEIIVIEKDNLTDAQRNKLRVLSSEYNLFSDGSKKTVQIENTTTPESENGNTAATMASNVTKPVIVLPTEENENETDTNWKVTGNLASPGHENVMNITHRKKILTLPKHIELPTVFESNFRRSVANIQNEVTPMSIDSTPSTECPPTELPTPSSAKLSLCTNNMTDSMFTLDSALLTANSNITDDGFKFPIAEPKRFVYETASKIFLADKKKMFNIAEDIPHSVRPMRLSKDEVKKISNCNLKLLLYQSVQMPLEAQIKLVNGEILKYFINDQHFFSHLHSLRCYYFLLDGEFGRNITEGLFNKLYEAKNPADLLNCRSLQLIINRALYASSKMHENAERLSFIVQNVPKTFDLSNADVLECLSLSYRINWPLNILLPCDTIEKYDIVFKYLLKLHYMSWVLQKMCKELKITQKEHGVDEILLMRSPQYHRVQLYRHIMTHFVQTLQNYTVSEVLQTSWAELENNMKTVNTLDQLYTVHILYVRTIIFRCLLNKKCAPIMKVINEIFVVILKFYNYLRSRTWNIKENDEFFTHPNFKKLEDIFNKFQEFTKFVFRVGNKMARVGYQPHLVQMLDMLNINDYYTRKQNT